MRTNDRKMGRGIGRGSTITGTTAATSTDGRRKLIDENPEL
jgi:hypothetical protein